MTRERFDRIEIIDLRGDVRRGERAGVDADQGVFNIMVGTSITLAIANNSKPEGESADVYYHDAWTAGLFSRRAKLDWLLAHAEEGVAPNPVPSIVVCWMTCGRCRSSMEILSALRNVLFSLETVCKRNATPWFITRSALDLGSELRLSCWRTMKLPEKCFITRAIGSGQTPRLFPLMIITSVKLVTDRSIGDIYTTIVHMEISYGRNRNRF